MKFYISKKKFKVDYGVVASIAFMITWFPIIIWTNQQLITSISLYSHQKKIKIKYYLTKLAEVGILGNVRAILVGKPQDKKYFSEYKKVLLEETATFNTPILYNVNIGHAYPRAALPYGALTQIDFEKPEIKVMEPWFA